MWRHVLFLLVLVGGALALSWLLIPRGQELALMHYKARSYGEALSGFEKAFYAPGGSSALIVPLRDLYLRRGELDAAVTAVARALAARPNDIEALDLALEVYRDTMHPERYLETLERRVGLAASVALVRELASRHAFAANVPGERDALELLHTTGQASAAELLRLARLQVADEDLEGALEALDTWRGRALREADHGAVALAVDIYLGAGRMEAVATLLASWVERRFDAESLLLAIELSIAHGMDMDTFAALAEALAAHPAEATLVLPAFVLSALARQPALLIDYVARLDAQVGLRSLRRGGVPGRPLAPPTAARLAASLGRDALTELPADTLAALARAVAAAGQSRVAKLLLPHLPPALAVTEPLTMAELALLGGSYDVARRRWAAIDATSLSTPHERLRHANLALALGLQADAHESLHALPAVDTADRIALAWIYHELDWHRAGLERFGSALRDDGSLAAMQAWALLATGAGAAAEVAAWLDAGVRADAPPPAADFLLDLTLLALREALPGVLERTADLAARRAGPGTARHEAARALYDAGQLEAAATLAARELDTSEAARRTFLHALVRLAHMREHAPTARNVLEPGFAALTASVLAHDGVDAPLTRTLVYDLLAVGATAPAYALLDELVRRAPETWYAPYREAALASGAREALRGHLEDRMAALGPDDSRYENYVYDLATLFGDARVLPHLQGTVARTGLADAVRENAFYALREVALRTGRQDWLADRLVAWLDEFGPQDALSATWLYELGALGQQRRALPFLEAAARAAGDTAARTEAFYAFQSAAEAAGEHARVVEFIDAALGAGAAGPLYELYVDTLFASPARDAARAALASLATADPARWGSVYLNWLGAGDEQGAALAWARHMAAAEGLPSALRRELAERLLAGGDKAAAIGVYRQLATDAALGSDEVATLLWLWGPRPDDAALDWLEARARAASGRLRAGWSELLAARGRAPRAATLLAPGPAPEAADPVVVERHVQALLAAGDKTAAAALLETLIAGEPGPAMMRWAARTAEEHALDALARRAWAALVALRPHDTMALRALGLAAFDAGHRGQAERHLKACLARVDDDVEAHFFYAEILSERGFGNRAAPHYQRVLALVDATPVPSFRLRAVRAQAHYRLGHESAARAEFEALLAERPGAGHLRADYVTMLLENRRLGRAREVIGAREVTL